MLLRTFGTKVAGTECVGCIETPKNLRRKKDKALLPGVKFFGFDCIFYNPTNPEFKNHL